MNNTWAKFLKACGGTIVEADGIHWLKVNKGLLACYFPHQIPVITEANARHAIHRDKTAWFARWQSNYGELEESKWWCVVREGIWDIESIPDKKERWAIRQGRKRLVTRRMIPQEVLEMAPEVANKAQSRYKGTNIRMYTSESFATRLAAGEQVPGMLEYFGVFDKNKLVGWAEIHVVDNACSMCTIKYDPDYLKQYSSYCLIDSLLDEFLNKRKMAYINDGERSIYHETNFQPFLIKSFGFKQKYSRLNVTYRIPLGIAVRSFYPFRKIISKSKTIIGPRANAVSALLEQEAIVRSCREKT